MNLSVTTGAPRGWTPSQPLITHKPPYPTEDLIRRSALYQLMTMTQSSILAVNSQAPIESLSETKNTAAPIIRSRRRGPAADKSKSLDLDLNPDI